MHKYEIYDRKSGNLLGDGALKEVNGQYIIQCLLPNSDDAVVFVDGKMMQKAPHVTPEFVKEDQIVEMYWSYGEGHTRLKNMKDGVYKSRRYSDLNFHVETKDGNDGKIVVVTIKNDNDQLRTGGKDKLKLRGTVSDNKVVFDNVLKKYT